MTTLRSIIAVFVLGLLAQPLAAGAQPRGVPRLGWLVYGGTFSEASPGLEAAVLRDLRDLGYVEGRSIAIDYRHAEGRAERLPDLAGQLVRLKADILLGIGGDVALALKGATSQQIPIVFATSTDPVRAQLVASLARPAGNTTGVTFLFDELAAKRVELLKEVMPGVNRVGVLRDPSHVDNDFAKIAEAARRLGLQLRGLEVRTPGDLDAAVEMAIRERIEALIVIPGRLTALLGKPITEAAARHRWPVVSGWKQFAEAGALLTYGPNLVESARRTAVYVDRILKGAKPSGLPVEQPTKFELVINLKAAKALGLTIPQSLLQRADQVIE